MRSLPILAWIAVASVAGAQGLLDLGETLALEGSLRDVQFVDRAHGWAVGDRGLVLRTADGGATWRRIPTPTNARLNDVCFIDRLRGWAVGGVTRSYTHESRGVVLQTDDGGLSWRLVAQDTLPEMRAIQMVDRRRGVVAGVGAALFPSGVFSTDDGGRHWTIVPGGDVGDWRAAGLAADRTGASFGALVGVLGEARKLAPDGVADSPALPLEQSASGAEVAANGVGWMVGSDGLVLATRNGGRSWRAPPTQPPGADGEWFDWRAVAAQGDSVWAVGAPGSAVLNSTDGGRTWSVYPTGITAPLTAVHFLDKRTGWAVGEFGVVLQTTDGGRSWQAQRGGDRRAAALFVLGSTDDLPAELLAAVAAGDGHRAAVVAPAVFGDRREAARSFDRLSEAVERFGGDATTIGPAIEIDERLLALPADVLRSRIGEPALQAITAQVRRSIVAYRPDVVAVAATGGWGDLLSECVVAAAASAGRTPPALVNAAPWTARRVARIGTRLSAPTSAAEVLRTSEHLSQLGTTPAQWRPEARGLLGASARVAPEAYFAWSLLPEKPIPRGGILPGTRDTAASAARRPAARAPTTRLGQLRRIATRRDQYDALRSRTEPDADWAGSVVNLTGGLDSRAGVELIDRLASDYAAAGRRELWAESLYLLARRFPDSPRADAALLSLVRYYASAEWNRLVSRAQLDPTPPPLANVDSEVGDWEPAMSEHAERAGKLIAFLRTARPALHSRPSIRMHEALVGESGDSRPALLALGRSAYPAEWRRASAIELALGRDGGRDAAAATCAFAPQRPNLDGAFDEPFWRRATELPIRDPDGATVAQARVAHDEEFLFLAYQVNASSPVRIERGPRRRDAELSEADRVRLLIDVDRDYQTAYELTVDALGRTHDSLDGDPSWDPRWYVAATATPDGWAVEAAIHLDEMVPADAVEAAVWAVSVVRERPGEPVSSWPGRERERLGPRGLGLLRLE